MAQNALTCGSKHIGIEESTQFRIIITGLEIIQFGLCSDTLAMRVKSGSFQGHILLSKTAHCDS